MRFKWSLIVSTILLFLSTSFAQENNEVMPRLYPYAGSRPSEEMMAAVRKHLKHRNFDPSVWPEIKISKIKEA